MLHFYSYESNFQKQWNFPMKISSFVLTGSVWAGITMTLSSMKVDCPAVLCQEPWAPGQKRDEKQRSTDQCPKVLLASLPGDCSSFNCFYMTCIYFRPLLLSHPPQCGCFCQVMTWTLHRPLIHSITGLFMAKAFFKYTCWHLHAQRTSCSPRQRMKLWVLQSGL